MPRMISFALTTPQFEDGSKDVTRRMGWVNLKAGVQLMAVEKAMGLGKGGKVKRLGLIEVISVRREPLKAIRYEPNGCGREGFPAWNWLQFVEFYCVANDCETDAIITRIEFRKLT